MNPKELLKQGLHDLDFAYSEEQIHTFMTFLFELKKWNRAYSLTALKTDKDIIIKHFLDSLLYFKVIPTGDIKIADAGTGAGFPAIPMKIIKPAIDITLIESSRKKAVFLRHMVRVLRLNGASIINKRIEALGENHEKTYDVIVSRATFKVKDFMKKACPYVKENGRLILSKGPGVTEELKDLSDTGIIRKTMRLPFLNIERHLLRIECKKKFHVSTGHRD